MSVSVVMLAYDEAENLKVLLPKVHKYMREIEEDYEIIVIDSEKSRDATREVCMENNASYYQQEKPCYGGAFETGIRYASMDKLLILDSDGSHDPKDIPEIYHLYMQGYDMVIGSRYTRGGRNMDARASLWMSKLLNGVMRICVGVKAKDISTSYRMYHTAQLKQVKLTRKNYDVLQEVILHLKINKKKQGGKFLIGETPIVFHKRLFGTSKRQLIRFILGYMKSAVLLLGERLKYEV